MSEAPDHAGGDGDGDTPERQRRKLLQRRDELRERLAAIRADYGRGLDPDLEEQAQQLENAEVLEGIARAAAEELEQIERQLSALSHR